ncbi:MAG TPA: DUF4157 domain-containing protein [Kofleriaceae bacterium]|nr:DUF4157 domain-containing protein [Kofleriaceae bacterium]
MAEAPAGGAGAGAGAAHGAANAQAAIAKHAAVTQADGGGDAATISRVEDAIKNSPMGWLQSMLGEVDSRAADEKSQVQGKVEEQKNLVAQNQSKAPKEEGAAPTPGPVAHPQVAQPTIAAHAGPTTPQPATGGTPAQHAPLPATPAAKSAAPAAPAAAPAPTIAAAVATAGGDSQLDGILNAYTPKAAQTTQTLGRIKQMGDIAQGFNGQLDVYVAQGGAVERGVAATANFLGAGKEAGAVWANNPYRKVHGILGGIMTGLSAVKNVCGVVGNICGKLGIVLTVIGLLGMIFPPIGVAVSGIARILNVVGIICEAVAFALSGILTGLNGVVLAQQIAAGSSAEEKAATADLMMSEANDAASGFVNMAMIFGPKFMSGLMSSSKGVVGALMRRAKATIGRVSIKASGDLKLFANKIVRKLGFGGAAMDRVGGAWKDTGMIARTKTAISESRVGKAWNAAPEHLEAMQTKLMSRYGDTAFARGLDRVGAWSGSVASKFDLEEKVGDLGKRAGSAVGNAGSDTKFAQRMTAAADQSELETRRLAMQVQANDAAHLEETRWQNYLDKRGKTNPDEIRSDATEQKFVASRGAAVRADATTDFEAKEAKAATDARIEEMKKTRFERHRDEYFSNETNSFTGKNARDMQMDTLHGSRAKRFQLEGDFKAQDSERADLLAKASRSAEDDTKLAALNSQLKPLDEARRLNAVHEKDVAAIAAGGEAVRHPDYKNWGDVGSNVWSAAQPALELAGLKDGPTAWQAAEKGNLKKTVKYDKGKAAGNAASRGGHGTYSDIAATAQQAQMADFANFVRTSKRPQGVGSSVRSMLSPITAKPRPVSAPPQNAPAPTTSAPTPAPGPTAVAPPVVSETMAITPQVAPGAPGVAAAGPEPDAPAPTVASVAMAAMEESAAQPLPYWPAMMPDFDHAQSDFGWMRKVGVEFKKAQIEGKQKAVDTLAVYGRYQEYAKLRAAAAQAHQQATGATIQSTQQNVASAGASESHAGQGESKQGEARGAANQKAATELPEPEDRGFWGRVLGAVKRWAKDKAAQVFGWIQEKIASVVLKGLCGVSMGDMRDYAGALKRQQAAAHGVAQGGAQTAGQANQTAIKLGADATKEAQGAADAIGECDRNITDADNFMADIATFEQQLAEEKAFAQTFLAQLHAEVAAAQAKQKADAAAETQRDARASAAGTTAAAGGGGVAAVAMAAMTASATTPQPQAPAPQPQPEPEVATNDSGDTAAVHSASQYVAGQGDSMTGQLESRADDYHNQLKLALTNHTGKDAQGVDLQGPAKKASKQIVDEFKTVAQHTKTDMDGFSNMSIDPSSAQKIADTIIQSADHLQDAFSHTEQALDDLFERTYAGIRDGKRTLKSRMLDGANQVGDGVTNQAIDKSLPTMTTAWNDVAAPIQVASAAPPVQRKADGASTAGDPSAVAQAGLGAGGAMPHGDKIQAAFGHHDVSNVRAHVGGGVDASAQQLGAKAYATGDDVAFAGGAPDLHTAAHEAAHVVQQRSGVSLKGGIDGGGGDPHEQHADAVADAVVAGRSAAPLLDEHAGTGGGAAVQRKTTTPGAKDDAADGTVTPPGSKWPVFSDNNLPYRIISAQAPAQFWMVMAWLRAADDFKLVDKGQHGMSVSRAREALGALGWIHKDRLEVAAQQATFELKGNIVVMQLEASAYKWTGLPDTHPVASRSQIKDAVDVTLYVPDQTLVPGTVIELDDPQRLEIIRAMASLTELKPDPGALQGFQELAAEAKAQVGSGAVMWQIGKRLGERIFFDPDTTGESAYSRWLRGDIKKDKSDPVATPKLKLKDFYGEKIPGVLDIDRDVVEAGHAAWLEIKVKWPNFYPSDEYERVPFVTPGHQGDVTLLNCEWHIELVTSGGSSAPAPAGGGAPATGGGGPAAPAPSTTRAPAPTTPAPMPTALPATPPPPPPGAATRAAPTSGTVLQTDIAELQHAFVLPEGQDTGTFRVTVHASFDQYFEPADFTRLVEVKSTAAAMKDLRGEAFTDMAARNEKTTKETFGIVGSGDDDDGFKTVGELPPDFKPSDVNTPDPREATRADYRKRLLATKMYLKANGGSQDALDAIDRQIEASNATDKALLQDRKNGWQPFQVRGTYLSRTDGLPSGALTLYGSVYTDFEPSSGDDEGGAMPQEKVTVQLRDLSRRFDNEDSTTHGYGDTFDEALKDAFVDLAKAYPKGVVAIEAESIDTGMQDGSPTIGKGNGKTVGFQLGTDSTWKRFKETVWSPVANIVTNLGAMAIMAFVPGSAIIVAPLLIAYNSIPAIDRLRTDSERGTLTLGEAACSVGEIALNVLPMAGEAKAFTKGWFLLEAANWGGQAVLMTAESVQAARQLQSQDVDALADLYQELQTLESSGKPPSEIEAKKQEVMARAKVVSDRIGQEMTDAIAQNALMAVAGSVIHNAGEAHRGEIIDAYKRSQGKAPAEPHDPTIDPSTPNAKPGEVTPPSTPGAAHGNGGDHPNPGDHVNPADHGPTDPASTKPATGAKQVAEEKDGGYQVTASAVPGSKFGDSQPGWSHMTKQAQKAHADAVLATGRSALDEALASVGPVEKASVDRAAKPEVRTIAENTRLVKVGDTALTIRVDVVPLNVDTVAQSILNPSKKGRTAVAGGVESIEGRYVIQLSDKMEEANVRRAVAHEVAEIMARRELFDAGEKVGADVLRAGSDGTGKLSPHDRGRVAELGVLAHDIMAGQEPGASHARSELMALVEELGLREGSPHADERFELVKQVVGDPSVAATLDKARIPEAEMSATDQQQLERTRSRADQDRLDMQGRSDANAPTVAKMPTTGADHVVTPAELTTLANGARAARVKKSAETLANIREMIRDGVHKKWKMMIGGNASLSARDPNVLLVDANARWAKDASGTVAQTAQQMEAMKAAGIGDPHEFADAKNRLPVKALEFCQDSIAIQGDLIDGRAELGARDDGTLIATITPNDGSAPVVIEVDGVPPMATGFSRENAPGARGPSPRQALLGIEKALVAVKADPAATATIKSEADHALGVLKTMHGQADGDAQRALAALPQPLRDQMTNLANEDLAKGAKSALDVLGAGENWSNLRAHDREHLLTGDEANQLEDAKIQKMNKVVIGGTGGTGISAAEIILDKNPRADVTMVGKDSPAGLLENDQFRRVVQKHGKDLCARFGLTPEATADNRFHFEDGYMLGRPKKDAAGGYDVNATPVKPIDPANLNDPDARANKAFVGDTYISALGRYNDVPAPIAAMCDAAERNGGKVELKALFDDDRHYIAYRVEVTPHAGAKSVAIDITGAASRAVDLSKLPADDQARVQASSLHDAPNESGFFDGAYAASTTQAARYGADRRAHPEKYTGVSSTE